MTLKEESHTAKSNQPKLWEVLFWPRVADSKTRNLAIKVGYWVVFIYALIWTIVFIIGIPIFFFETHSSATISTSLGGAVHAVCAAILGWGLIKKSKIAAAIGLSLACLGFLQNLLSDGILASNTLLFMYGASSLVHYNRAIWVQES